MSSKPGMQPMSIASTFAMFASAAAILAGCARVPVLANAADSPNVRNPRPIQGTAGKISVDDGGGGGTPLVFVHSFGGNTTHWGAQLAHFRHGHRVVALDLRGHGNSAAPADGNYNVGALASDIGAVVDQLDIPRFVLVGHSMGGAAAIEYAASHPDRVLGLVLVGTPGRSAPEQSQKVLAALDDDYDNTMDGYWTSLMKDAQPNVETQLRGEMHQIPQTASVAIIKSIFEYDPLPSLTAYPGPKLLVDTAHGENPGALHNIAPQIRREVIAGTSHWPHMDKPEEFNGIMAEFLAKIPTNANSNPGR